jgi:hypothetical protein
MARDRHFLFDRKSKEYEPDVADFTRLGQNATSLGNQFRSSVEKNTAFEMSGGQLH